MQRLLEAEQAKRDAEAREAARKLKEEQDRLEALRKAAEEAEAKAARARKPENIEAHQAAAEELHEAAARNEFFVERAEEAAEDARIDTLAKPADMVRTRLAGGQLATMAQQPEVKILDASKLDKELLWPFIKEEHLLMALKAWAKTKSYKTPMAGAHIKMANKGQLKG
jgi:chromosome condensin MukBEF ATPase and DNA-binding subunit MukB